jgi:hypothetical protein
LHLPAKPKTANDPCMVYAIINAVADVPCPFLGNLLSPMIAATAIYSSFVSVVTNAR